MATHEAQRPLPTSQALLLGTLAPGLNAPTWAALQAVMLALGVSLVGLFCIALGSSSLALLGHVMLLLFLAGMLFVLLNWFVSQTGLVTVEQQMKNLNLTNDSTETASDYRERKSGDILTFERHGME